MRPELPLRALIVDVREADPLGAAPGGWSQIAARVTDSTNDAIRVAAIDFLEMDNIPGVHFIQMDFLDDEAPVKAEIIRKAFRGSEFLYTLRLASGETVLAHVPSHHNHTVGEWIGIRAEVDHVVTFNRACPPGKGGMCELPCAAACSEPCGDPARADGEHAVTLVRGAAARAPSTVGAAD